MVPCLRMHSGLLFRVKNQIQVQGMRKIVRDFIRKNPKLLPHDASNYDITSTSNKFSMSG